MVVHLIRVPFRAHTDPLLYDYSQVAEIWIDGVWHIKSATVCPQETLSVCRVAYYAWISPFLLEKKKYSGSRNLRVYDSWSSMVCCTPCLVSLPRYFKSSILKRTVPRIHMNWQAHERCRLPWIGGESTF